ncbi:MAG: hypothetical protein L6R38_002557 [Xanthoria sp. 2 TBL-2021]|nr:MAG: hypothetical protein L6R38_002557 [Xanthoria sp. 2 TBL-2021]
METERKRPHRRERRRPEPSPQPNQPLDPMLFDQTSDASAPLPTNTTIARSMSRYKGARPKPSRSVSTPSVPAVPPVKPSAGSLATAKERPTTTFARFPHPLDAEHDQNDTPAPASRKTSDLRSPQNATSRPEAVQLPMPEYDVQASSHGRMNNTDFQGTSPARPRKDSLQRHQLDSSRTKGNGSRHARADRAVPPGDATIVRQDIRRNARPIRSAMIQKKSFSERIAGLVSQSQSAAEAKEQLKSMISNPIAIDPKNHLALPQFDAPKSAVNAGERTVRVKYKEFQVPVTVVPSTTPTDVIRSVSDKVATTIDQDSAVMLESFKQLGLERPLRKYEHIRDVLNSWDNDSQNTLIIEQSSAGGQDDDLDVKHVPRIKPDDASFYLYHSQRPGHWDKRVVLVRSDGQMLVAKSNGGEFFSICHLSDFDIYVPTAREMAKKIRPPKRICFAVKSQQKSNMFVSTVNFVHFFASNDKRMAMSLYTAVQGWRSWYLVNMMGKGAGQSSQSIGGSQRQAVTTTNVGARPVNLVRSPEGTSEAQRALSNPPKPSPEASRRPATQKAQHPAPQDVHPAYRNNVQNDRNDRQVPSPALMKPSSTGIPATDPFTGGGLLGRTYTQRKKAQQDHEPRHSGTPIQIPVSSPSPVKADANGLKRASSQRQKPKPLIDLTPVYQEPPQHSRKGKGVTPGHIPAGGLIDIATSPEVAIPIPPKNDWRRPGTSSGADASPIRAHQY